MEPRIKLAVVTGRLAFVLGVSMENSRNDVLRETCEYCNFQDRSLKSTRGSFPKKAPRCPKCGLVQPSRSQQLPFSLQEEQKRLSDRIDLLNQRLAALQSNCWDLDRSAR